MSSKLVNTKLSPNPTRVLLNQHLTDLLVIDGNSTADPDKLRQFYMILMDGLHPTHLPPFLSTQGPHTQCCSPYAGRKKKTSAVGCCSGHLKLFFTRPTFLFGAVFTSSATWQDSADWLYAVLLANVATDR